MTNQHTPLTEVELAAIEQRLNKATPGPVDANGRVHYVSAGRRTDVDRLVAEVKRLRVEIDRRESFAEKIRIRAIQTGWMEHLTDVLVDTLEMK